MDLPFVYHLYCTTAVCKWLWRSYLC